MLIASFYMSDTSKAPNRSPRTIYLKSRGSSGQGVKHSNNDENRITRCFTVAVQLKNDSRVIKCANCFFLYDRHYNGIKQKPHDYLFQKSGQRWTRRFASNILIMIKIEKMEFYCGCTTKKWFQYHKLC